MSCLRSNSLSTFDPRPSTLDAWKFHILKQDRQRCAKHNHTYHHLIIASIPKDMLQGSTARSKSPPPTRCVWIRTSHCVDSSAKHSNEAISYSVWAKFTPPPIKCVDLLGF